MTRGAVIIIEGAELILMERVRLGKTYYLFPGGGVEQGETVEQAAVREAYEELGLEVDLGPLVAVVEHDGNQQRHFLASIVGGVFGSGDGPEYGVSADPTDGTYKPVRLRLCNLGEYDVRPRALAAAIASNPLLDGSQVLHIKD